MAINFALYHPKWPLIPRLIGFKRAEGKCERCSCQHGKPHRSTGYRVSLATVHLNHDRTNNRLKILRPFAKAAICGGITNDICITASMARKPITEMVFSFQWKK